MTDIEIENEFTKVVATERKIAHKVLQMILQIEDRRIHLKRGCSDLVDYLIRRHGYSETCARSRVKSARLLRVVPEISEKLEAGSVNLSTLSRAQTIIRAQEKATGQKIDRREVISKIENKTLAQTEQTLFEAFPEAGKERREHIQRVTSETHRLSLDISNELYQTLKRLEEIYSHQKLTKAEILLKVTAEHLARHDALQKRAPKTNSVALCETKKRAVKQRDSDECQWRDPLTNQICASRNQIEVDHIIPKAKGGTNDLDNLRCLCKAHNQLHALLTYGAEKANEWRSKQL